MDAIFLLALLLLVLLVLGMVQAVRIVVWLFGARGGQDGLDYTTSRLRRLRDQGYITPGVYEQVMAGLAAWKAKVPPQAAAHFAARQSAETPDAAADERFQDPSGSAASPSPHGAGTTEREGIEPTSNSPISLSSATERRASPPATRGTESTFEPPLASAHAPPPLPPRRAHRPAPPQSERADLFAAFLERRNIRWGELLGGLLILGCSAALVVSFWAQIADRPIFKFALFTLVTAAFFGVGLYSEHRWKLPTTSRAILLLATLLVPVNLLAIAALGGSGEAGQMSHATLAAQLASLAIFTLFIWPAARVLVGKSAPLLCAGLATTSLTLIFITSRPISPGALPGAAAMPAGCLLICAAIAILRLWKMPSIGLGEAIAEYLLLGAIGFAAWLAVGFGLFTAPQMDGAVGRLSPIFTALGLPAFFMGLVVWKRASYSLPWYAGKKDRLLRARLIEAAHEVSGSSIPRADNRIGISGMALAIFGTAILLAALAAAWPGAARVTLLGTFDALLLAATAILFDLPAAYVPAAMLASMAWLIGFHCRATWFLPTIDDSQAILSALGAGDNGWLMLPMGIVLGLGAVLAGAMRRPSHRAILGALALVATAASVGLANFAILSGGIGAELDPACFDLLVGGGFLLLWTAGLGSKSWAGVGAIIPLLLAEWLIVTWHGVATDDLVGWLLPVLPIALCIAVPAAMGLICMRRKVSGAMAVFPSPGTPGEGGEGACLDRDVACFYRERRPNTPSPTLPRSTKGGGNARCNFPEKFSISSGILATAGLMETLGIALAFRWHRPADVPAALTILRSGHVISAWAMFALGAWARWRIVRFALADESGVAQPGGAVPHRSARGIVEQTVQWAMLTGVLAFIGCVFGDGRMLGGADGMMALCLLAGCLACWADMPGLLFVAGVLLNMAGTLALLSPRLHGLVRTVQLPMANVLFLVFSGGVALLLDRLVFARRRRIGGNEVAYHLWASWAALVLLAVAWSLRWFEMSSAAARPDGLAWAGLAAVAALFAARLWKPAVRDPIAGIYLTGLLGISYVLAYVPAGWAAPLADWSIGLGLYGLLSAAAGAAIARMLPREHPRRRFMVGWLRIGSAILAGCAVWGAVYCDWNGQTQGVRMLSAIVACALGAAIGLLAEDDPGTQAGALAVVAAGMVAIAWAAMPAAYLGRGLDMASAGIGAVVTFAIGLAGASKFGAEKWWAAIRSALVVAVAVAAVGSVAIVVAEATDYASGDALLISRGAVIGIECELMLGCAAAITAAMGTWPILWAGKSACVWAAEALAALAFVHLRVTEPWMFNPRVEQYWPIVVLAMAFLMLGGGFALNRRGRGEIGRPMVYSGIAWPMAAIFGYWLHPTIVDYSAVLWLAGALYGMAAAVKRSLGFTLLAAACMNGALWVVLGRHPESEFFVHPQLWLIPAALSVLAAAQMHHRQLGVEQMRSVRYLCLAVIYLSSTADVVLNGVMASPWLPMVLAALAIAGVLAGILWHIRPFLYLGTTFLLIAVLMMIWTAQENLHWTWLWYVAGLSAGVALFAMFGLFEKRHEQITRLIADLKQWQ